MQKLDVLILGAGWTSTFLIPLLQARKIAFAATTRDGREVAGVKTIKWSFDPSADTSSSDDDNDQFSSLPLAKCVLISFPLTGHGQSTKLVKGYENAGKNRDDVRFVQLGSTGIWQIPQEQRVGGCWIIRQSPYDTHNARAIAEDELLRLNGCVLNLAGLWGGERDPRHWVQRVAKTKEEVRGKKSLHMIHGVDVARAILAVMGDWSSARGQRWMITDGFVYDWWSLFAGWADEGHSDGSSGVDREPLEQATWVYEIMREEKVLVLPRSMETLGRCYASGEFWETFQLVPLKGRI